MPTVTLAFDPTATSPSNYIQNEEHALDGAIAVMPLYGSFYRENLRIEGIMEMGNNTIVETLRPDTDYLFSPIYIKPSAVAGVEAYSYILVQGTWDKVRIAYQAVGGPDALDTALLTKVSGLEFDRTDLAAWLNITGSENWHPSSRNPLLRDTSEIEILNSGLEKINDSISRLAPDNANTATQQQVTNLEVRQATLELDHQNVLVEFNGVKQEFSDIKTLYYYLESLILRGKNVNVTLNGGHVYHSEVPTTYHLIQHNLNTEFVDVTIWVYNAAERVYYHSTLTDGIVFDANTIRVDTLSSETLLVVVRPIENDDHGHIYESEEANIHHEIFHTLDNGFLSCTVWTQNEENQWVWTVSSQTLVDDKTVYVDLDEPRKVRVLLQRPLDNAFLYKSENPILHHRIHHNLYTPQVGVTVWVKEEIGNRYSNGIPSTQLLGTSIINVDLDQPRVVKVIVQPALVMDSDFETHTTQRIEVVEDRLDTIRNYVVSLETLILDMGGTLPDGGSGITREFRYNSLYPDTEHVIIHNLNDLMTDVVVWVSRDDGNFYQDDVLITQIDANTVKINLVEAAFIRAKITKL